MSPEWEGTQGGQCAESVLPESFLDQGTDYPIPLAMFQPISANGRTRSMVAGAWVFEAVPSATRLTMP